MPRYYRKRYTRVVKPRKRWATNLVQEQTNVQATAQGNAGVVELVVNSLQAATPTPVIIKTGNFKLQFEYQFTSVPSGTVNGASMNAFVVYAPEGIVLDSYANCSAYVNAHPEYIMGIKSIDIGRVDGNTNVTTMSSRLKRNLNSGDRIVLIVLGKLAAGSTGNLNGYINILGQYWTTSS